MPCGAVTRRRGGSPWFCLLRGEEQGSGEQGPAIATFRFSALHLTYKPSELHIFLALSHFRKIFLPQVLFPALSKSLVSILLVGDHLCNNHCALNLLVSFPLHFSLIVSSASPVANPSQPPALPSTQEQGRKVAQQLIPVPLLLWSISSDAVRAGQQCKHQPPFSFPPPALRPHSPSQLHTDLPPRAPFPPPTAGHPPVPHWFLCEPAAKSIGSEGIQPLPCSEYSVKLCLS